MRQIPSLILVIVLISGCTFSQKKSMRLYEVAQTKAPYDAIIVPGVPHHGEEWPITMKGRVLWSLHLYQSGITKHVIYSGGAVYTKYSEAKIMAEYGKALGIPEEAIFTDTLAEHSSENIYYSYRLAKDQGFTKVGFATDPFQAKQLKGMVKKLELPIDLIPFVYDSLATLHDTPEPKIDVNLAVEDSFVSIKDREGFFTRLQGTLGKHIKFQEEDLPNEKTVEKFRKQGRLYEEE